MCCKTLSKSPIYDSFQKIANKLLQYFGSSDQNNPYSESICTERIFSAQEKSFQEGGEMAVKGKDDGTHQSSSEGQGCAGEWMQMTHNNFILQKVQNLVHVFHDRAEKVKERITQVPTPSPTPPLAGSSEGGRSQHGSRPRLESLIEQEDVDQINETNRKESVQLGCCQIRKSYLPSFPAVLDPQSKIYITWLFFVMLSYVYNAWVIILRAVFPYQTADNLPIFLTFDYIADIIYVIDIALFKVRLQFLHDGFWVDDPEKTRKNYLKKVIFKMDLLSLLPLDVLYFIYGTNPLFRLPRLLKTQTFWEFFHRVDAVAKTPYVIRIIRTLLYMMYLIHLNACAYYAMSTWEGIGTNGWVFQGEGNAYIRCFYFATKTATSIGKNPKPENEYEYVFMTVSWLMGVFIFAFLIGQIRDIVATATQSKTQYRQLMDQTVMYMRNLNLPDELQRRVRLWLNHTWEQQKTLNEGGILDSLPRKMKTDVAINVHYNTLVKVQLFKDCDKALLRDLVLQLKPVLFLPGDYICRKGEVGKEMYIVNKGLVQVTDGEKGEIVLATLSEGSVFGEISLLGIPGCSRRTADVRSQGFSNLFVLSKDDLWEALKNYPEAQKVLRKKAKMLIKENEARDRASKNNNVKEIAPVIIKHDVKKPTTPQLLKTVMQVVPKDSKCAQMLVGRRIEKLPSVDNVSPKMSNLPTNIKVISGNRDSARNVSSQSSARADGRNRKTIETEKKQECVNTSSPTAKETTETKSSTEVADITKLAASSTQKEIPAKTDDEPIDILKTIRNLLPSDFYKKRLNTVHPKDDDRSREGTNRPKPNVNNSEDSGISIDLRLNSSVVPIQKSEEDSYSTGDSEDTSELSTISSRRIKPAKQETQNKEAESQEKEWTSPSPSVFSLHSLFRTNSSKSFPSQVEVASEAYNRSGSLTSSSTSAGYDNLAFLPVDLFSSRRSSMFSDTSC